MTVINDVNWRCFLDCVGDLLFTPEVQSMRNIPHHPGTTCYEHSVFVAYAAFRMARRWNLDYMAAAGAACSTTCTSTTPGTSRPTRATSALTTRSLPCATPRPCAGG